MAGSLGAATDASAHLFHVLAESPTGRRGPTGLSPLQPAVSSGRRAAGLGVPAPPAAGARGTNRGHALRRAPDAIRIGGLRVGARHSAGGHLLLWRALAVARGPP